ncbi:MAG: hypothetical protein ACPG6B_03915 [Oceanihabitans sp.]
MKKITLLILCSIFISFFNCDNETLEGEFSTGNDNVVTCVDATISLTDATQNYSNSTPNDANYATVCSAYANALENVIAVCGDESGTYQLVLESLDCSTANNTACTDAQTAANIAQTAYNADPTNATLCTAYKTALQNQIATCGDANGSLQDTIDGLSC